MADTPRFTLPLLAAAQAQKHVTVNEALARVDALMHLRLLSVTTPTPPLTPPDGAAYGLPSGVVNDWAGHAGEVAIFVNGGWAFVPATQGLKAYVVDQGGEATFDGATWVLGVQTVTLNGAGMVARTIEVDHTVSAGPTSSISFAIPGQSVVYGVTGRVVADITGTATGFSLGVAASTNRYGSGLSLAQGAWLRGLTGAPLTYYAAEDLVLTAEGGSFTGGTLRLAVHCLQFTLPSA